MVCPYCAENTEEGSVFCTKCGTRLAATVSTPVATRWPVPGAPAAIPGGPIAGDTFPYAESHTSGMAVGSLISGIFFFFFPVALIAIVLGHLSLSEIKKSAGRISGRGMAIAGLVLGYLGVAFIPLLIIAAIAIPNFTRAKMAANEAEAVGALKSYNYALATYAPNCPAK